MDPEPSIDGRIPPLPTAAADLVVQLLGPVSRDGDAKAYIVIIVGILKDRKGMPFEFRYPWNAQIAVSPRPLELKPVRFFQMYDDS